jgi:hypothetical protein
METRDHGLEHKETRPRRRGLRKNRGGMTATGSLMGPVPCQNIDPTTFDPPEAVSVAANSGPASPN